MNKGGKVPSEMNATGAQQKDRTIVRTAQECEHHTATGKRSRVIPPMDWEPKRKTKGPEKNTKESGNITQCTHGQYHLQATQNNGSREEQTIPFSKRAERGITEEFEVSTSPG